jgi:hypothetical protein
MAMTTDHALQVPQELGILPDQEACLRHRKWHRISIQLCLFAANGNFFLSLFIYLFIYLFLSIHLSLFTYINNLYNLFISISETSLSAEGTLQTIQRPEEPQPAFSRRGQHQLALPVPPPAEMSETPPRRGRHSGKGLFRRQRSNVQRLLHVARKRFGVGAGVVVVGGVPFLFVSNRETEFILKLKSFVF